MAVHQPEAWVICVEPHDEIPVPREQGDVAARPVGYFDGSCRVKGAVSVIQDPKVVAVQVDGVGLCLVSTLMLMLRSGCVDVGVGVGYYHCEGVLDNKVDPRAGVFEPDDVLRVPLSEVSLQNLQDGCSQGLAGRSIEP